MMKTAKEPRELVEASDVMLEHYLTDLESALIALAKNGKTSFIPENDYTVTMQNRSIWEMQQDRLQPTRTPLQERLAKKLQALGYRVEFQPMRVKVGGGLGSMDDEVTYEMRSYIKISW